MGYVKAQDFPPRLRGFFDHFEGLTRRHDAARVYADWLRCSVCAFACGAMEGEYLRVAEAYERKELAAFGEMLAEWVRVQDKACADGGWDDLLGVFYEVIKSSWKASALGQFFTPAALCDLTVQLQEGAAERTLVNDPSCGSGRLLLAHHAVNREARCYYVGQDLDRMAVDMTLMNMVIHGMRGEVVWGNTLTMEVSGAWLVNPCLEDMGLPGLVPVPYEGTLSGGGRPPFSGKYRKEEKVDVHNILRIW